MLKKDFWYDLPKELIAQEPADPRDAARLMVLDRKNDKILHSVFHELPHYLEKGDLLVVNNSKVLPARLMGTKVPTGAVCELLLLRQVKGDTWECLARPGKRMQPGTKVEFGDGSLTAVVDETLPDGNKYVTFTYDTETLYEKLDEFGKMPLPPYITKQLEDQSQYQTVYAMSEEHSAAAPTAGLHFTPELIQRIKDKGCGWATVELEVGIDTFRLVEEDDPTEHVMHTERYHVPAEVVEAVHVTKAAGHRVIAVGTTAVRSLESAWDATAPAAATPVAARGFEDRADAAGVCGMGDIVVREDASTNLYLMPGSTYHVVDALITNFHVPRSTLMMLVSALATREQILDAYEQAVQERYRFFSFGDAMLIR